MSYTTQTFCVILRETSRRGRAVFGELVIAYLFLAGVGAGGTAAASLADLFVVRDPFGEGAKPDVAEKAPAERLIALVFVVSGGAMVLGAACLALDLGRLDRVIALFLSPPTTLMNLGAWAVTLLAGTATALALVRVMYVPAVGRGVVAALEVVAIALAIVVAAYAGLLLRTLTGVRLWSSVWVPVLFVLSAASCGCALMLAAALFFRSDRTVALLASRAARADAVVIVFEAVAGAFFLAFVLGGDHPGAQASGASLMEGSAALPWWVGFVACGISVPLIVEAVCLVRDRWQTGARSFPAIALALSGVLVLVGAMGLRTAVVDAGVHRDLELQEPQAALEREDVNTWLN
ncbi:NrfD/PsrC family molybdoenzyme membrane anchor subunit [Adlercreutzia sp. R25]|uniref:NrfD/PsrC family molybdoenzyme membrane anchor subunit n=1 Tax=Adlercreutzia shanghongiae TaxID=3111773 RepID=UPI002DBAD8A5|nr:NrfD/PsrC family molybdoenzyme membrane anchor subunit [Adlercreutzia sp. R25]MEC4271762.1 NrfD/PsrC family molybdoenzyme membrane anchor subunit [Adlercreutzia sp. R25]